MTRGLISPVYSFGSDRTRERRDSAATRPVRVSVDVLEALQPSARERGISVPELAQRLLETIATEKMVTAVLDDAPRDKPRGRNL